MSDIFYVYLVCVSVFIILLGLMVKNILQLKKVKSNEKKI